MTIADEIQKLEDLFQAGALTEPEFQAAKTRLLQESSPPPPPQPPGYEAHVPPGYAASPEAAAPAYGPPPGYAPPPTGSGMRDWMNRRQWGLLLHLSQFLSAVVPMGGFIAPIVIWQCLKDDYPEMAAHGKMVTNWQISALIYLIAGIILSFFIIGIPLVIAMAVCTLVFPIVGALKANEGEVWEYPMTIPFL